jgi:hypothetical protein
MKHADIGAKTREQLADNLAATDVRVGVPLPPDVELLDAVVNVDETARVISAPVSVVDGNVVRVLARVFGLRADVTRAATQRHLWALATALLPARGCGDFNQALMELGALVCTARVARCGECPVRGVCKTGRKVRSEK